MCSFTDVTAYASMLRGKQTIRSWLDTVVNPGDELGDGWQVSAELVFYPGPAADAVQVQELFLGVRFVYYLGEESLNVWELGLEGGYDLAVGEKFVVRPQLGLGLANLSVDIPEATFMGVTVGGGSVSSTEFYLAPGVSGIYDVTDSVFLGVEARFKVVMADETVKAITLLATGGMRF